MVTRIRIVARGPGIPARDGVDGKRIAVQLHGAADGWDPFPEFLGGLRDAGAEVVPIRVYRWKPVPLDGEFDQLVAASPGGSSTR